MYLWLWEPVKDKSAERKWKMAIEITVALKRESFELVTYQLWRSVEYKSTKKIKNDYWGHIDLEFRSKYKKVCGKTF